MFAIHPLHHTLNCFSSLETAPLLEIDILFSDLNLLPILLFLLTPFLFFDLIPNGKFPGSSILFQFISSLLASLPSLPTLGPEFGHKTTLAPRPGTVSHPLLLTLRKFHLCLLLGHPVKSVGRGREGNEAFSDVTLAIVNT